MVNAIISEFNPFHNGHKYLLETARKKTGAKYTVCFMSGAFVQRGDIAFADRHLRAKIAVMGGADIVFLLPTAYSVAGASVFGEAGVYCARSLGVDTNLCFGSESEDISGLFKLARVDRLALAELVKKGVDLGKSYANALMDAYSALGAKDSHLLRSPNNLLAFEYIKASINQGEDLNIVNIKRCGAEHDSDSVSGNIASASYIRNNIDTDRFMPFPIKDEIDRQKFSDILMYSILSKTPKELSAFADMTEGLENKFAQAVKTAKTPNQLFDAVKSKRYTHAKIRRAAISVLLQNPKGLCKEKVPYLKVLAFNDNGRQLLKTLEKTCALPIVTKASDGQKISARHFELDSRASDIFDFCKKEPSPLGSEFTRSPVYVK